MVDIKKLAPNARVNSSTWEGGRRCSGSGNYSGNASYADMIYAAATARLALKALNVSEPGTSVFRELIEHLEPDLAACVSSLTEFSYDMGGGDFRRNAFVPDDELVAGASAIQKVLKHIKALREPNLFLIPEFWNPTPAKLVLANNFSQLERLRLSQVVCEERKLVVLLSGCRSTLRLLCLSETHLIECMNSDEPWLNVLRLMSSMDSLNHACVGYMYAGGLATAKALTFGSLSNIFSESKMMLLRGREKVAAGFK